MNVLFINDSTSNTNWGDRAAATALKQMVAATGGRIGRAVTEAEIVSSTFRERRAPSGADGAGAAAPAPATAGHCTSLREHVRPWLPPAVLEARRRLLSRHVEPGPEALIPQGPAQLTVAAGAVLRERRFGWPSLLEAIAAADVTVIHGASMDGHGVFPRTILFLTYLIKRHFDGRVVIANHTADFTDPRLRRFAEAVYPLFDDVLFRDPISAERCASLCDGRFAPDSAFLFEPAARAVWTPVAARPTYFDIYPHQAHFDPAQPYLCIGGSSILWAGWDPPRLARDFGLLVDTIRDVYDGQVVLTAADVPDERIFELVAAELDLPLVGVTTPVQQVVDILGNADAYIGGRWHPGIFALRGGTPVLALSSKTFKTQALMRAAALPETTFDSLKLGEERDRLVALLRQHLDAGEALRERLRSWAAGQAESAWDNVTFLQRLDASR